jgi:hypothetical protein
MFGQVQNRGQMQSEILSSSIRTFSTSWNAYKLAYSVPLFTPSVAVNRYPAINTHSHINPMSDPTAENLNAEHELPVAV